MANKNKQESIFIFVFIVLTILSTRPILKGGLLIQDDLNFHLLRIEGLTNSLLQGIYLPKINSVFLYGYGYAADLFYPNLLLYIAAIFHLVFSLATSYKLLLAISTFMTFTITYFCTKPLTKSRLASFISSILFTLSSYRLIDIYMRGALGEILAFIFIPFAVLGIYYVLFDNERKWHFLVIGMSGLLLTHILSSVMMLIIIVILSLLSIRRLLNNRRKIFNLMKAGIVTIGICAFFILPIIEQMSYTRFYFQEYPLFKLSEEALSIRQLVIGSFLNQWWPPNIGLLIFLLVFFRFRLKKGNNQRTLGDYFLTIGIIFFILTTDLFPWIIFEKTPLISIQFPWRFLIFSTYSLALAGAIYTAELIIRKQLSLLIVVIVILASIILPSLSLFNHVKENAVAVNEQDLNVEDIGVGKEYLPIQTSFERIISRGNQITSNQQSFRIDNYSKKGTNLSFDYRSTEETQITLPVIFYKGYSATVLKNGQKQSVELYPNENYLITANISGSGKFQLSYKGTFIQFASNIISLTSFIIFLSFLLFVKLFKAKTNKLMNA